MKRTATFKRHWFSMIPLLFTLYGCLYIFEIVISLFFVYRKTKYFRKGRLDWDETSPDGIYVRDNCKSLKVRVGHFV